MQSRERGAGRSGRGRAASARLSGLLAAALTTACAATGAVPEPFPGRGRAAPPAARPQHPAADGYAITATALGLRGAPYRNGGTDPSGFDCSGFIYYVMGQHGIEVPRSVSEQFRAGKGVDANALVPGDLVFFSTVAPGPTHVGMSIGGDEFVHAPSTSGVVRVERLTSSYWAPRFVGARRID